MSSKNFKIKEGLTLQGAGVTGMDTNITADNNGGILIGGVALSASLTELNDVTLNNPTISVDSTVFTTDGSMFMFFTDVTGMYMGPEPIPNTSSITTMVITGDLSNNGSYPATVSESGTVMLSSPLPSPSSLSFSASIAFTGMSSGTSGQVLKSTGTGVEWGSASSGLPSQSLSTAGKYLTSDGTDASWATVDLSSKADLSGATFTGDINLGTHTLVMGDGLSSAGNISVTSGQMMGYGTLNLQYIDGIAASNLTLNMPSQSSVLTFPSDKTGTIALTSDITTSAAPTFHPVFAMV